MMSIRQIRAVPFSIVVVVVFITVTVNFLQAFDLLSPPFPTLVVVSASSFSSSTTTHGSVYRRRFGWPFTSSSSSSSSDSSLASSFLTSFDSQDRIQPFLRYEHDDNNEEETPRSNKKLDDHEHFGDSNHNIQRTSLHPIQIGLQKAMVRRQSRYSEPQRQQQHQSCQYYGEKDPLCHTAAAAATTTTTMSPTPTSMTAAVRKITTTTTKTPYDIEDSSPFAVNRNDATIPHRTFHDRNPILSNLLSSGRRRINRKQQHRRQQEFMVPLSMYLSQSPSAANAVLSTPPQLPDDDNNDIDSLYSPWDQEQQLQHRQPAVVLAVSGGSSSGGRRAITSIATTATTAATRSVTTIGTNKAVAKAASSSSSLSFVENMICGAVSRSIAQTIMHPMNTAKTILQNGRGPDRPTLRTLLQPNQFRRLTNGAGANFILSIPHGAVNFAVLEFVRGKLNSLVMGDDNNNNDNNNNKKKRKFDDRTRDMLGPALDFMSSAIATITCSVVSTPQMMITDNIMAGNFPDLVSSARGLYKNGGGIVGLYAGWWPGLVGKIPSYALTWTFFQQLKRTRNMLSDRPAKNYENTIMGGMASAATVCIMIPMDTIKTRLVTQSSGAAVSGVVGTVPYKGIVDCATRIAREEGIRTFYRGLAPRLVSVVPMIAIQFSVYEAMKRTLLQRRQRITPPQKKIPSSSSSPSSSGGGDNMLQKQQLQQQYGPEEIVEEAAMESSASGSLASPAPQFHKKVLPRQKRWKIPSLSSFSSRK